MGEREKPKERKENKVIWMIQDQKMDHTVEAQKWMVDKEKKKQWSCVW